MASVALRRLTTQYIEAEDRLRITGEVDADTTLVLWLTQRLALRMVPPLLGWLQPDARTLPAQQVLAEQGFAQEAARASLAPQPPVAAAGATQESRVDAVDFQFSPTSVRLVLRGPNLSEGAHLVMEPLPLRQWLGIVHQQFVAAQWPMKVWPAWMAGDAAVAQAVGASPGVQLH